MKTRMMRALYGPRMTDRLNAIDYNERAARRTHASNLKAIANARKSADNLKRVLELNHVSIQIHNATGNTNNDRPSTRPQP